MGQDVVFRAAKATVTLHMEWHDGIKEEQTKQILERLKVFIRELIRALRTEKQVSAV